MDTENLFPVVSFPSFPSFSKVPYFFVMIKGSVRQSILLRQKILHWEVSYVHIPTVRFIFMVLLLLYKEVYVHNVKHLTYHTQKKKHKYQDVINNGVISYTYCIFNIGLRIKKSRMKNINPLYKDTKRWLRRRSLLDGKSEGSPLTQDGSV